jgi:hypothetical protein
MFMVSYTSAKKQKFTNGLGKCVIAVYIRHLQLVDCPDCETTSSVVILYQLAVSSMFSVSEAATRLLVSVLMVLVLLQV